MSTSTISMGNLGLSSQSDVASLENVHAPFRVFAGSFAALIILIALVAPDCCLTGSHVHSADLDGFGPVCSSRAVWR